jgi:hypothetical protein
MNYELTHLRPHLHLHPFRATSDMYIPIVFPLPSLSHVSVFISLYSVIMGSKEEAETWKMLLNLHKREQ